MRYEATVRYEGKSVTFKVTNQILQGRFELKDFLKSVRESRNHCIQTVHLMTDFGSDECEDYETGRKRIPEEYLRCFATAYHLPMKLVYLGYNQEKETKSKLAQRLKELRLQHELPQIAAAFDLDISRSTYAGYETGKNEPDIYTLIKIADYYKVSLDYLVGRT